MAINRVPFVAYLKIIPERGQGKRFEIQRSRQKFAHLVHLDLMTNFQGIYGNIAEPGGSQEWTLNISADANALSNVAESVAVKPQFGDVPDTLTVVGFYNSDVTTPYPEKTIIHAGQIRIGPASGAPAYSDDTEPTAASQTAVATLKSLLESSITSVDVEIIRLELNGVAYGRGALHFPRLDVTA